MQLQGKQIKCKLKSLKSFTYKKRGGGEANEYLVHILSFIFQSLSHFSLNSKADDTFIQGKKISGPSIQYILSYNFWSAHACLDSKGQLYQGANI